MNPQQIQAAVARWKQARELQDAGRYAEAEPLFRQAMQVMPANAALFADYALLAGQLGDWRAAEALWRRVGQLDPARPVQQDIGRALLCQERYAEALAPLEEHAQRHPDDAVNAVNLAVAYTRLLRDEDAIAVLRAAVARAPDYELARESLAILLINDGRRDEAGAVLEEALARFPRNPELRYLQMEHLLKSGEFGRGFDLADVRWDTRFCQSPYRVPPARRWDGKPLAGTLLVRAEQGLGDELIYSSLFADLFHLQPRCVVACDPRLVALLARTHAGATGVQFIPATTTPDDDPRKTSAEREILMGDLPRLFRRTAADFPTTPGWLRVDEARAAGLRDAYRRQYGNVLRVGLSWRSKHPGNGAAKTLTLEQLLPVLQVPGMQFFDLQYGDTTAERASLGAAHGIDVHRDPAIDPLTDIDGLAAQMTALDLVISTSNSTVHLAGAVGVPTWVLLHRDRGTPWYWSYDAEQVPLYPRTRLFRCTRRGEWETVVATIADRLAGRRDTPPGAHG